MSRILITGGTIFVSKYVAKYYVSKGYEVYVLNRNTHKQIDGVTLINCDRHDIGDRLKKYNFDVVLAINTYTKEDIECLINALGEIKDFIFISSSAVYPESLPQPFTEEQEVGPNKYWGDYGIHKYQAEKFLQEKVPQSYILRPPYLYGPMNNVYREAFVFECALNNRKFYVPKNGNLNLQFFYIGDLCKFIDILLEKHPQNHIFNVGNFKSVSVIEWIKMCYQVVESDLEIENVYGDINQRSYFCFYDYDYRLDVSRQMKLMKDTKPLLEGIKESYMWYKDNSSEVMVRPYIEFIDDNLK